MKVFLSKYSTDGSSLSEDRCQQICLVYDLCSRLGDRLTSYKDIQDKAVKDNIFGFAKADSVIRTIFPLLKKLGFVSYHDNGEFKASSFFTDTGKSFILALQALEQAKILNEDKAIIKVRKAIVLIIQLGIINLSISEYKNHNILLAIEILRQEKEIYWNELLYILSLIQTGDSISSAIQKAKQYREKDEVFEYYNTNGKDIKNTAYSYVRSFLIEADIITSGKGMYSKLNPNVLGFVNSLPHYGY